MRSVMTALLAAAAVVGLLDGRQLVTAGAQELTKATVRLAFTYNGHRSAYLLGIDKGFIGTRGSISRCTKAGASHPRCS